MATSDELLNEFSYGSWTETCVAYYVFYNETLPENQFAGTTFLEGISRNLSICDESRNVGVIFVHSDNYYAQDASAMAVGLAHELLHQFGVEVIFFK